jgi:GNAT superfamily N-acetyltransferase
MTDVLGTCESWADGLVVVRREQGDLVTIPTGDIVAGKTVPPRPAPASRLSTEEADRRVHPGWRAVVEEALGEWLLRASGGFSNRGNSVLALGDPGLPLEAAVATAGRWYDERGLVPRAHVLPGSSAEAAVERAGWTASESATLMVCSVARALRRTPGTETDVRHDAVLDPAWLATDERAARYGEAARTVLQAGEVTFATVRNGGTVLARGRGAVHGDWLGVSSLWTAESHRGQGLGTAVLRALLEWGAERGATTAYLQVAGGNATAMALYESRGFEPHHEYVYYERTRSQRTVRPAR